MPNNFKKGLNIDKEFIGTGAISPSLGVVVVVADNEFAHVKNMVVMSGGCWWVGGGGADAAEYLFP